MGLARVHSILPVALHPQPRLHRPQHLRVQLNSQIDWVSISWVGLARLRTPLLVRLAAGPAQARAAVVVFVVAEWTFCGMGIARYRIQDIREESEAGAEAEGQE